MADFFSNLLARSGSPVSGAILQPRLPSLFESIQGADEFATPQMDTPMPRSFHAAAALETQPDRQATGTFQPAQPQAGVESESITTMAGLENDRPNTSFRATTGKNKTVASQLTERQVSNKTDEPTALFVSQETSPRTFGKSAHSLQNELPADGSVAMTRSIETQKQLKLENISPVLTLEKTGLLFNGRPSQTQPDRTVRAPIEPGATFSTRSDIELENISPALTLEKTGLLFNGGPSQTQPDRTVRAPIEPGAIFSAESAIEMENVSGLVDGSGPNPQPSPHSPSPFETQQKRSRRNIGVSPQANASVGQFLKGSSTEPVVSRPVLKPVSMPLPREPETLVQVHIGRIEVQASAPPPAPPEPMLAPRSQPKMSLDDYLRQREDKR